MKRRNFLKITLPLALVGNAAAAPAAEPEITFGVIADPQYADAEPKWGRFYRNSLAKLEVAIADLNGRPLEFVAALGDLIDRDFARFASVMPIYAKLTSPHFPPQPAPPGPGKHVVSGHPWTMVAKDADGLLGNDPATGFLASTSVN